MLNLCSQDDAQSGVTRRMNSSLGNDPTLLTLKVSISPVWTFYCVTILGTQVHPESPDL